MLVIKPTLQLPSVSLTGFETPLTEEERAIQDSVHQFAKNVLRPIGPRTRQDDGETGHRAGFALLTRLRRSRQARARSGRCWSSLPPDTAIRVESMIGEEMGWGDAGLAVSLAVTQFPAGDGRGGRATRNWSNSRTGKHRLLDDHPSRQGHRRRRLRHEARMGAGRSRATRAACTRRSAPTRS